MRALSWAIRVTFADGRQAFVRVRPGGVLGSGPIATFYSESKAFAEAARLRPSFTAGETVTVIERSHGRQFPDTP